MGGTLGSPDGLWTCEFSGEGPPWEERTGPSMANELTNSAAGSPVGGTHGPPDGLWSYKFGGGGPP